MRRAGAARLSSIVSSCTTKAIVLNGVATSKVPSHLGAKQARHRAPISQIGRRYDIRVSMKSLGPAGVTYDSAVRRAHLLSVARA